MGDDDDRAPLLGHRVERRDDRGFRFIVQGAGRFVEHDDGRVLVEGSGDREPLPLPSRKADPALADQSVVAVRQLRDEAVQLRMLRGRPHPVEVDLGFPAPKAMFRAIVVSARKADCGTCAIERCQAARVLRSSSIAIDGNLPGRGFQQAHQQVGERAFSAPCPPDDRHTRSSRYAER